MGKNLQQQARGKGTPRYRALGFNYAGAAKTPNKIESAKIVDLIKSRGHSAPLLKLKFANNEDGLMIAPEGIRVGETIQFQNAQPTNGNTLLLKDVPEGSLIYNIEAVPGDGGKFVRSAGTFAKLLTKTEDKIVIALPSKKQRDCHPMCRATIGIVAGSGRDEKPILKAGVNYHKHRMKNQKYPQIGGAAQNAVDHPFGNKRTSRKSKARPAPKNAPPGRNVGYIRPRRTGQKKGRSKEAKK
jgi:large subunit ribosomal protein L2